MDYPDFILTHDQWIIFNRELVVKAHALNTHFDFLLLNLPIDSLENFKKELE